MDGAADGQAQYFLRSERLGFRLWREGDLRLATALWGDPQVTKLIDVRGKLSDEQVNELLNTHLTFQREHGIQYWPIFLLTDGECVGCCGLRPYDPTRRIYELGVHIRSAWWRHGLAKEAASAVISYAFDNLGAAALFAGHNPNNHASQGLLEKLGFEYTHHEYYDPTGLEHPSYLLKPRPI
jgi:[ribosomal protein S5]-alanine N-acetyltransferase